MKASVCRLGVTNGEKIIKAKAVERLKGDSEATEQRKAVTVGTALLSSYSPSACQLRPSLSPSRYQRSFALSASDDDVDSAQVDGQDSEPHVEEV